MLIISLGVGAVALPPGAVFAAIWGKATGAATVPPQTAIIIWDLRLPRALLAIGIGAGLAVAGTAYQAIFRNPLADPFVIGASGARPWARPLRSSWGWRCPCRPRSPARWQRSAQCT